jgi:hypothetical protein
VNAPLPYHLSLLYLTIITEFSAQLTPRSQALLHKPPVAQLLNNFRTWRFITVPSNGSYPVHTNPCCLSKVPFLLALTKILNSFHFLPCVLHDLFISSSRTRPFWTYSAKSVSYEAPHYAIVSKLQRFPLVPSSKTPSVYWHPLMSETKFYGHTEPQAKTYSNFYANSESKRAPGFNQWPLMNPVHLLTTGNVQWDALWTSLFVLNLSKIWPAQCPTAPAPPHYVTLRLTVYLLSGHCCPHLRVPFWLGIAWPQGRYRDIASHDVT